MMRVRRVKKKEPRTDKQSVDPTVAKIRKHLFEGGIIVHGYNFDRLADDLRRSASFPGHDFANGFRGSISAQSPGCGG
jgi:hypothetical protein